MGRELTPAELHELLPAYALDAVDGDERAQIEEWLARTPEAQAEVDELRETAARLAHVGDAAPPTLWSRIEDALGADPPGLVLPMARRPARTARKGVGLRVAAAVAATVGVAATTTVLLVNDEMARQEERLEEVARSVERTGTERAAEAALADPASRTVELVSRDGRSMAMVVAMPDGRGYLMHADFERLAAGRTYQLWAMTGTGEEARLVSAGVLGPEPGIAAFRGPGAARGYKVTTEREPGAVRAQGPEVASGQF
jgi:hypothetical protein